MDSQRRTNEPGGEAERHDDVDRLFERWTALPAPRGFYDAIMCSVAESRPLRLSPAWLALGLLSLLVVLACGYVAGQAMVGGGLLDLAGAFAADASVVTAVPGEVLLALTDAIPWVECAGAVLALAVLRLSLQRLGRRVRTGSPVSTQAGVA